MSNENARSNAALKAWDTRRENERKKAEKLSNAAKKAWVTRRKKAQKRSDAAKKAWKTRRSQSVA